MAGVPRVLFKFSTKFLINSTQFHKTSVHRTIHTTLSVFAERLFTQKHEWVQVDGKIGTVGISDYAQQALGDVVYAQLPEIGTIVQQKDECGALESVKAASEIYSPISGKIIEKNLDVEQTPSLINSSCYDKGWLFKLELTNDTELTELMNEGKYKEYLKSHDDDSH